MHFYFLLFKIIGFAKSLDTVLPFMGLLEIKYFSTPGKGRRIKAQKQTTQSRQQTIQSLGKKKKKRYKFGWVEVIELCLLHIFNFVKHF